MKKAYLLMISYILCSLVGYSQQINPSFDTKKKPPVPAGFTLPFAPIKVIDGSKNTQTSQSIYSAVRSFEKPSDTNQITKDLKIVTAANGLPIFIKGVLPIQNTGITVDATGKPVITPAQPEMNYLAQISKLIGIKNPEKEFYVLSSETDILVGHLHTKMQQHLNGIPVWGAEVILHSKDGEVYGFNGNNFPTPQLPSLQPSVSSIRAIANASLHLQEITTFRELSAQEKEILGYQTPFSELVIYHLDKSINDVHLAWHLTIRPNFLERYEYFVDALTGEVIDYYNHTCADGPVIATGNDLNGVSRTINTYQVGSNKYYMLDASRAMYRPSSGEGALIVYNGANNNNIVESTNNTNWSPTAISAQYNGGKAYEYFFSKFGRNSINGKGGSIISLIDLPDPQTGKNMDNAFWNGGFIAYGKGDVAFKPLAGSLDVAGHEMSHGVVQNSANLEYRGQSGALNESFADIFGAMMDREDWKIGEDIVKSTTMFPSGALRDMSNPNNGASQLGQNGYQPATMEDYYSGKEDNEGVHINSGIVNYAYYLFATSANMSKEKAEQIYYTVLTTRLTKSSQFMDLRLAVIDVTTQVYGATSPEVAAAYAAFDSVGITDGSIPPSANINYAIAPNPGQDYILSYNLTASPTTFQRSSTTGTNLRTYSFSSSKTRPSITDDGSVAFFVDNDNNLRSLDLSNPDKEVVISSAGFWGSVAISKDGNKIALTSIYADTAIYILNLISGGIAKFQLYNPTFTQGGLNSKALITPDALEWDYTGQYVMYDANTKIGDSIDYWDINFIKVWDNELDEFGSGEIEKLFANLPKGVNLGNPTFAKTTPNVVVYDYLDRLKNEYFILGTDFEKPSNANTSIIVTNNTLGYPNLSKLDNRMIYTTISGSSANINGINLTSTRINSSGSATRILSDAKWGVWYATGTRNFVSNGDTLKTFQLNTPTRTTGVIRNSKYLNTVNCMVTASTNLNKSYSATFTTSDRALLKIEDIRQLSGSTRNVFNQKKYYSCTVVAESGRQRPYTLNIGKPSEKDILIFGFVTDSFVVDGVISDTNITVTLPPGRSTFRAATFLNSPGSVVRVNGVTQVSDTTVNDFANPLTYVVTAFDGTTKTYTVTVTVAPYTRLNDEITNESFVVFPNPNNIGKLYLSFGMPVTAKLSLVSTSGVVVAEQFVTANQEVVIPTNHLTKGVYLLQIHTGTGVFHKKVVIE
jgi:Zn-dependent metalloprotease